MVADVIGIAGVGHQDLGPAQKDAIAVEKQAGDVEKRKSGQGQAFARFPAQPFLDYDQVGHGVPMGELGAFGRTRGAAGVLDIGHVIRSQAQLGELIRKFVGLMTSAIL